MDFIKEIVLEKLKKHLDGLQSTGSPSHSPDTDDARRTMEINE